MKGHEISLIVSGVRNTYVTAASERPKDDRGLTASSAAQRKAAPVLQSSPHGLVSLLGNF